MSTYVECIDDICNDNISNDWLPLVPDIKQGSEGNFYPIFNKNILYNFFKSRPISGLIQIATLESKGIAIR